MAKGHQILADALKTFVFSLSEGAKAQAALPGRAGARAGAAAALAGPFTMQQQQLAAQQAAQQQAMAIQKFRSEMATADQNRREQLLEMLTGRQTPTMTVQNPTVQQAPIPDSLTYPSSMSAAPAPQDMGTREVMTPNPEVEVAPGMMVRPPNAQQMAQAALEQAGKKSDMETANRIKEIQEQGRVTAANKSDPNIGKTEESNGRKFLWNTATQKYDIDMGPVTSKETEPSLQSKEIVDPKNPKGPPIFANFNPKTGQYLDPATGQPIPNARPYERPQDPAIAAVRDLQATLLKMQIEGKGLTPNQRGELIMGGQKQWTRAIQPIMDRRAAVAKLDVGLRAIKDGNYNAANQIIITAFNKLQDEASVVREGEYLRSEQGQAVAARIQGALERISRGGSSLREKELRELATEAKNIATELERVQSAELGNLRQALSETLDEFGIPRTRVFGSSTIGQYKVVR